MATQAATQAGLEIWRYHARRAESASRNSVNCRVLLANLCHCKPGLLADDATRYALEAQKHSRIAMTFRDCFQPITRRGA